MIKLAGFSWILAMVLVAKHTFKTPFNAWGIGGDGCNGQPTITHDAPWPSSARWGAFKCVLSFKLYDMINVASVIFLLPYSHVPFFTQARRRLFSRQP